MNDDHPMNEHERLRRVEGDLELIQARIGGVQDSVLGLADDVATLVRVTTDLANVVSDMRAAPMEAVSAVVDDTRKVWVAEIPAGDEHGVGPVSVMIEQFGDRAPTVAFRRERQQVWGRPYRGEVR